MKKLEEMFEKGWYEQLSPFFNTETFKNIGKQLVREAKAGATITPKFNDTFRAFKECRWSSLHTVIVGLDPYPGKNPNNSLIADGLAFSARESMSCPKSLRYILEALDSGVLGGQGYNLTDGFDLTHWARQGILLLNSALTLPLGAKAGAHVELWRPFITHVLKHINEHKDSIGAVFFGSVARSYMPLLTNQTYFVASCEHPSAANYHGGKWAHEDVLTRLTAFHNAFNNIKIEWQQPKLKTKII